MAVKSVVPTARPLNLSKLARTPRGPRPPAASPVKLVLPHVPTASKPRSPGTIKVQSQKAPSAPAKPTQKELGISAAAKPKTIPTFSASFMGSKSTGAFTAAQMLEILKAKQRQPSKGLLDEITSGAGSVLGGVLNVLSRPGWAVSGATGAFLNHESTAHIAEAGLSGLEGKTHGSFGQILQEHGILKDHTILRAITGIGLDIATDPTNLLLIAATPETGGLSGAAFLVKEGLIKGLTEVGTKATVKDLMTQAGRHEAEWQKVLDTTPFGQHYLGNLDAEAIKAMTPEQWGTGLKALQANETMKAVRHEAERFMPRKMTVGIWLPTVMGGRTVLLKNATFLRVMPYAPNMLRIAEGLTPISHIPGVKGAASGIADLFKPGWRDPIIHATKMGEKHTAEAIFNLLHKTVHADFLKEWGKAGVSPVHLADALDVATRDGAAIEHANLTHTVDENFLRGHGLDQQQIDFVKGWNDLMNKQIVMEHAYGVVTEGSIGNRVYVPYKVERGFAQGGFKVAGATKSFQHAREGDKSLAELRALVEKKAIKDTKGRPQEIVTDPVDLIRARMLQGSQAMATAGWRAGMTDLFGVPVRVIDAGKTAELVGKNEQAQQELERHLGLIAQMPESHNAHMEEFHAGVAASVHDAAVEVDKQIAQRQRAVEELRAEQAQMAKERTKAQAAARRQKKKGVVEPRKAQQRAVANARGRASRAGSAIAEELVRNLGLATHLSDHLSAAAADNSAEGIVAREVAASQHALNQDVNGLNMEISQLQKQGAKLKDEHAALLAQTDLGVNEIAAQQAQAVDHAKESMTAWIDGEIAREEVAAKQAHRILGPARNRVAALEAQLAAMPKTWVKKRASVEEELRAAREQVALHEPRAGQVGQKRVENVRSIGEKIAADLRNEDEKWRALGAKLADQIKEAPAEKVGALQAQIARVDEMRKSYKELAAQVANARTKKRLYDLVGESHGRMIDEIGKRTTVVDTPLLEHLTVLRQKIQEASTGDELHQLAPEHPALEAFTHGGQQLAAHGEAAHRMNEVAQQLGALQDRLQTLVAHREEAALRQAEHKADNAHLFKQSDEFKARVKEREAEAKRIRKQYEASLSKLETLHGKLTQARADGMREQAKLHEMGGVEPPAGVKHHGRTITRLEREIKQLSEGRDARLMRIQTRAEGRRGKLDQQLHKARAESFRMEDVLRRRAEEAQKAADEGATMRNPRIDAEGLKTIDSIPGHAFTPEMHAHLTRVEEVMSKPEGFEDVSNWLWRQMSRWKLAVTVLNPIGYRVRNTLSDVWNMYLNGMPLRAIPFYFVRAHRLLQAAKHGDVKAQAYLLRAEFHGVMQGLFRGDVDHAYAVLHRGHVGGRVPLWNRYVRFQINTNTHAENMGRLAHLMWRQQHSKTGLRGGAEDFTHAAVEVRRSHFDYEDLTPFEQHVAKSVMPFYTWTRKNVPYQLQQIMRRPGRVANFSHVVQESELASGSHKGELIPSFFEQSGAFRIPGLGAHWYFLPNIGLMDISRMTSKQGWEGMLGPQFQIPITLMTNRNLFTGGQIKSDTHNLNPVNPLLAHLLSHVPFMDVGMTQRMNAQGKEVKTTGMNPYALYLLESLGIPLSRVAIGRNPIDEQRKNNLEAISGQLGLPVQYADQAQQKQIIDMQEAAQLKLWLEQMRANSQIPEPTAQKKSKHRQAVDQLIYQSYGRP